MYNLFNKFLIRAPHLSFDYFRKECGEKTVQNTPIQEAIYIASPVLHTELQKLLTGEIKEDKEKDRIHYSLYKYTGRMATRCTPFGLFAGCTLGETGDQTHIVLGDTIRKHTRLDMFYLCALSQELSKIPAIRNGMTYYPNTSLYPSGKKYRYVEYQYRNSKRIHRISAVERSSYLDTLLKKAAKGAKINELSACLTKKGIPENEALAFIEELIDSQIIVGAISPSVTGDDYFCKMIELLETIHPDEEILSGIKEIKEQLIRLDLNPENPLDLYKGIVEKADRIKIPYEEKYLFQVDMTRSANVAVLGKEIIDELQTSLLFLNKITPSAKNETLAKFRRTFYERYEDREVPLMEALDPESGIGYPVNQASGDVSPLLDNFLFPGQTSANRSYSSDALQSILFYKIQESLKQHQKEIIFTDEDIKTFKENWKNLPPTLYCLFEMIRANQEGVLIKLNASGGSCGANLLARFAHTDEEISRWVKEIAAKEQELTPDIVLAEIAHLPDSRTGNILHRPHIRDYEIVYLAHSDLPDDKLIYMSDLTLSVRQGKICLRSKKLNKEIIPRLTNAHNYRKNPMPAYQFLCDMQMQNGRNALYFDWGHLGEALTFLPRVRYKNTILSLATWKIKADEIKHLFLIKEDEMLMIEVDKWREKRQLPKYVLLPDGDNELFVDWENVLSIRALFSVIKKRQTVAFTEFLFEAENAVVKDKAGNPYLNECIVSFYKNGKI